MVLSQLPNVLLIGILVLLMARSVVTDPTYDVGVRKKLSAPDWAYMLWAGIAFASAAWSVAPTESLLEVIPLTIAWLATLFFSRLDKLVLVRLVIFIALWAGILSLAVIPLDHAYAYQPFSSTGQPELRGIFYHQLRLGEFMAVAIGFIALSWLNGDTRRVLTRRPVVNLLLVALLIGVMVLSRARGLVGIAFVALILTWLICRPSFRKLALVTCALAAAILFGDRLGNLLPTLEGLGVDTTLTGRTIIWSYVLDAIAQSNTLLGNGFGTLRLPSFDNMFGSYRPAHAHNSYLQALFETGILGLGALILLILAQIAYALRYAVTSRTYSYSLFLVIYATLGSMISLIYAGRLSAVFGITLLFLAIEGREVGNRFAPQASSPQVDPEGRRQVPTKL